ncbi:flagellin and related hook-associated proteins [Zymobacter palmae]|uniref:Flagellin and related hook-associated proteins n=1 Tax=Zymobacter palmae TaxID=33074 RepID=A0A348HHM3_9GAMM|nr:flagellin and related hook-associated proteins [Zymobacter palmae]
MTLRPWALILQEFLHRQSVVEHTSGEAPFVVVPRQDFNQFAVAANARLSRVESRRVGIVVEVNRNQRFFVSAENRRFSSGFSNDFVDFFNRSCAFRYERQVNNGNVDSRNANSETVQFAFQLRQNQSHCRCRTSFGRDHGVSGAASTTRIFVVNVDQVLVVGVGVDRGHQTFNDTNLCINRFSNRRQAVSGARSVGNDVHVGRQDVFVYAVNDSSVSVSTRARDQNAFSACFQVQSGFFTFSEDTGAFHDQVNVQFFPRQASRVTFCQADDFVAVDIHCFFVVRNGEVKVTMSGIVFEQVSVQSSVTQVVDGNNLDAITVAVFVQ